MSALELAVVVISYRTPAALRRCLASLPAGSAAPLEEVLVIDNASCDGSAALVRQGFPSARLLENHRNLGFARAVNQALAATRAPHLLVLNADIEVLPGSIDRLAEHLERTPHAGLAAGALIGAEGELQPSCRRFYTGRAILLRRTPLGRLWPDHPALRQHLMLDWDHASPRVVDWVQGACLLLRRRAALEVGGLDERFFLYFEDVDLCRRLALAGWEVWYVPAARFLHGYARASVRPGLAAVHHLTSGVRYWLKWHGPGRLAAARRGGR